MSRNLNWSVYIAGAAFSPGQPGLKGDIVLEYNSVGACVSGEVTLDGYWEFAPFGGVVRVYAGGTCIWLGTVGLSRSTLSPTGQRTTQVSFVGLDVVDRDGLAVLGLGTAIPEAGVWGGIELNGIGSPLDPIPTEVKEQDALGLTVTRTVQNPPPFGETVGAGLQRMFRGNPVMSWGVRPDGRRVAGWPSGGGVSISVRREDPGAPGGPHVQPSNHEVNGSYVSEFVERAGERWQTRAHTRPLGSLTPRRGTTVQSDTLLGDSVVAAPLSRQELNFGGSLAERGHLLGVVNLRDLVAASHSNPLTRDATYVPTAITVDVTVRLDAPALPDVPPEGWYGQNVYPLGTWQDTQGYKRLELLKRRLDAGPEPQGWGELKDYIESPEFPYLTTTQNADTKVILTKDRSYWEDTAVNGWNGTWPTDPVRADAQRADYPRLLAGFRSWAPEWLQKGYTNLLAQEWGYYTSQYTATVEFGEWLTRSRDAGMLGGTVYESAPVLNPVPPQPPQQNAGEYAWQYEWRRWMWEIDPKNHQARNAQYALDPKRDPGLIRPLYKNVVGLNLGNRRELNWRFEVPKELLGQLDPTLGDNYNWAIGIVFSAVHLGLKAKGQVTGTAYYSKRILGTTNTARDIPGYDDDVLATPTYQGIFPGEIHTGPLMVNGQWATNLRVIIGKDDVRTEFQTGAPNGGQ